MSEKKPGLFARIWRFIARLWRGLDSGTKKVLPVVIDVIDKMKQIDDTHLGDVVVMLTSGIKDDKILARFREILPKVIKAASLAKEINDLEDDNEKLKRILAAINSASDPNTPRMFWTGFAQLMVKELEDGFTWADVIALSKYIHDNREQIEKELEDEREDLDEDKE